MVQGSYVDVVKRDAGCGVNLTMFGGRACARFLGCCSAGSHCIGGRTEARGMDAFGRKQTEVTDGSIFRSGPCGCLSWSWFSWSCLFVFVLRSGRTPKAKKSRDIGCLEEGWVWSDSVDNVHTFFFLLHIPSRRSIPSTYLRFRSPGESEKSLAMDIRKCLWAGRADHDARCPSLGFTKYRP